MGLRSRPQRAPEPDRRTSTRRPPTCDVISTGDGDLPWEDCFRTLDAIGSDGPFSVEWEDAGMDRLVGAAEAVEVVRRLAFDRPDAAFDAAFSPGERR